MSLIIKVTWGTGCGPTSIAAFDQALVDAGIAQYNLIYLSSVIPEGSEVLIEKHEPIVNAHGNRLYTVIAHAVSSTFPEIWAGLGWAVDPINGRGIFVEHTGNSKKAVENQIVTSLSSMRNTRPELTDTVYMKTVGMCRHQALAPEQAICATVCAVYKIEPW